MVDLLRDHRQTEQPEHLVEAPLLLGHVDPRQPRVPLHHLPAREHAGSVGGLATEGLEHRAVVVLHPVGQRTTQIHERVADGGHLPVQDTDHVRHVVRVQHQIVEAEVVVDEAVPRVLGLVGRQPRDHRPEIRHIGGAGAPVAGRPALDLATHIALTAVEIGEPGGGDVHRVQLHQRVDGRLGQPPGGDAVQAQLARQVLAQDPADHPLHHIELGADHRAVVAESDHARHQRVHRPQRRLHPVFAAHVVGATGLGAGGRATQHQVRAGVSQQVGEVRGAARVLTDLREDGVVVVTQVHADQHRRVVGDDRPQPRGHRPHVERVLLAHRAGTGDASAKGGVAVLLASVIPRPGTRGVAGAGNVACTHRLSSVSVRACVARAAAASR